MPLNWQPSAECDRESFGDHMYLPEQGGDMEDSYFVICTDDGRFFGHPMLSTWNLWDDDMKIDHSTACNSKTRRAPLKGDWLTARNVGADAWDLNRSTLIDTIFMSTNGTNHEDPGGCGLFAPVPMETRWPMYKVNGKPVFTNRLLVPYSARHLNDLVSWATNLRGMITDGTAIVPDKVGRAVLRIVRDGATLKPGFDPADWPDAFELFKVKGIMSGIAIASLRFVSEVNEVDSRTDRLRFKKDLLISGLPPRDEAYWKYGRRIQWDGMPDDVKGIILGHVIAYGRKSGPKGFVAALTVRGVCKNWKQFMDVSYATELMTMRALIRKARKSTLIADWLHVREYCHEQLLLACDVAGEMQAHPRGGSDLVRYMRLKTGKNFGLLPSDRFGRC